MTEFYFVRHGQTTINQQNRFNGGRVDSALTETGVEGAKKAGEFLKDVKFDHVFVSPQKRAQTTAKLILAPNKYTSFDDVVTVEDLREINQGDWEGQIIAEHKNDPQFENYYHNPIDYDPTDTHGESFPHVIERSRRVISKIFEQYPNDRVLIVSHGTLLLFLLKTLQGVPLAKVREGKLLDNDSVTIMKTDDDVHFDVETWNDTSFI